MSETDLKSAITSLAEFPDTPVGWQNRWEAELNASSKMLKDFHKTSTSVVKRFLDERDGFGDETHVNLFWSNVRNLQAILFSSLPTVDVSRKFQDQNDDVARVAALLVQRMLDFDIAENGAEYETVLEQLVQDRLLSGLACSRMFYDYEAEMEEVPPMMSEPDENGKQVELAPGYEDEKIIDEAVTCEYYFWKDVRWSWSRNWRDLRWIAFRTYMDKDTATKRFGEDKAKELDYKQRQVVSPDESGGISTTEDKSLWKAAEIWEIWDKDSKKVFWVSEGQAETLEDKSDPLKLRHFFPVPRWWMANTTTTFLMPKSDYAMSQDLYHEIDSLQTRISILTTAVKVVGVYDKQSDGIQRMLDEGMDNELIPVDNWAMFAEKGGIQGQIDWLPLEQVVNTIQVLQALREDNIMLLEKVTGMSDIVQGVGTHPREGVGTQRMKAEFGSVSIQSLQEGLSKIATDMMELKAEMMCKLCSPEKLVAMSNASHLVPEDQELVGPAIELLKDWDAAALRIKVRSESMARVDYTRLKEERTEYINAMALFMQSAAPLVEIDKSVTPTLLEMLKWGLAGFKGSNEIEGVLDKAIEGALEAMSKPEQPETDPKAEADIRKEQVRAQAEIMKIKEKAKSDLQIIQAKMKAKLYEIQAKSLAEGEKEEAQAMFNTLEKELEAMLNASLAEAESDLRKEEIALQTSSEPSG